MSTAPTVASAVTPATRAPAGAAKPYFDSRVGDSRPGEVSAGERAARAQLRSRLGVQAVVDVDPLTGTARNVQRLDGALTRPAAGDRSAVALDWVRANRTALGLTGADVDSLALSERTLGAATGISHLRYRQSFRGIPAFDNDLRVNLDRGGRILSVAGSPVSGLSVPSVVPDVGAVAAMRALQRDVGVERAIDVTTGPAGDRRVTRFANGDFARLVLFDAAGGTRLAWHLTYQATSVAYYDAVVDATTGAILFRQNLTKFDAAQSVFPNYPGAENDPDAVKAAANAIDTVNFEGLGWLVDPETELDGPNAHVFSDVNDNDAADGGEEISRANGNADFPKDADDLVDPAGQPDDACAFTPPPPNGWIAPLATTARCSWDPDTPFSWQTNREQNGVAAFYLVNDFHDHLEAAPIGFDAASGNFEGVDKIQVNTDDGANKAGGLPDAAHIDNANMTVPPDNDPVVKPKMQMYLFAYDLNSPMFRFRNINGGDDAATVWHEYTHGLSSRLITHADGSSAVSSPHAGAMGEAWSDWYALDLLHQRGLEIDNANTDGEVDIGIYSDAVFASTRFEPVDCPVENFSPPRCPGGNDTGPGGFTFGDFGHVLGFPEVHSDGEIWTQTLWDLRTQLGSAQAEALVTEGMRLSPPEPSFLDMRNAILAADVALAGGDRSAIWEVFRKRGMGFYAGAADSSDTTPVEDFTAPPSGASKGRVGGAVTSSDNGLPVPGVTVGFGGLTTVTTPPFPDQVAPTTSAANGTYSLQAPAGRYGALAFSRPGYDQVKVAGVTVTAGATRTQNAALRRDWSSRSGGATVVGSDTTGAGSGCGPEQLIDQAQGVGWSPYNPASQDPANPHAGSPRAVITLPRAIDITAFGLDPGNTCGDDITAATRNYTIDTSADGVHYARALTGTFAASAAGTLNVVTPTANAAGVRYVRLTLLSPQRANVGDSGADFIDFSEIEVFGGPRNVLPSGVLHIGATRVNPGDPVLFGASFTDPDSKITGYRWDFDGNGSVDRTTSTPTTTFAYAKGGDYTARVAVTDFRGGAGTGAAPIHVTTNPAVGTLPRRGTKGRAQFRVSCDLGCTATAKLTLSKKLAKQLGLKNKRSVGSLKRTLAERTSKRLTITLTSKAKRALKRHQRKSVKATLAVTVRYADGRRKAAHRTLTIKL